MSLSMELKLRERMLLERAYVSGLLLDVGRRVRGTRCLLAEQKTNGSTLHTLLYVLAQGAKPFSIIL